MMDVVWVAPMADKSGYWLSLDSSERYPNGKRVKLHGWRSMDDAESLEALDAVLGTWGIQRQGPVHADASGRVYVTIAQRP
ncbi:hypothetical protein [Microbacterium sp. NPDC056234]|uniref:hypothetical protein n=1 Tax=Microbacterium sp. NPDC056234 TaxID=3345757 RepID=UPI0035DFBC2E